MHMYKAVRDARLPDVTEMHLDIILEKTHVTPCKATFTDHSCRIGNFRVAFRFCFKASPGVKPFIWKLVLFTCK